MSRSRAVGLTVLLSLLLIVALVIGYLAGSGKLFSKSDALSEPYLFDNTRYEAEFEDTDGLATNSTEKNTKVIIRFFDGGRKASILVPDQCSYTSFNFDSGYRYTADTHRECVDDDRENIIEKGAGSNVEFIAQPKGKDKIQITPVVDGQEKPPAIARKTPNEPTDEEKGLDPRFPAEPAPTKNTEGDEPPEEESEEPEPTPEPEEPETDMTAVTAGTVCGEVTAENFGSTMTIVAIKEPSDCDTSMEVFTEYYSANPRGGQPRSTSAIWDAPNGWYCSKAFPLPGGSGSNYDNRPSCGPNENERHAVAVEPEYVDRVQQSVGRR